jgi:hypothetical protein
MNSRTMTEVVATPAEDTLTGPNDNWDVLLAHPIQAHGLLPQIPFFSNHQLSNGCSSHIDDGLFICGVCSTQ